MRQTKTIGSILLDVELVTPQDIEQALKLQKQTGKRLGEVLVSLDFVSDDDIRWALAEQLNLPYVNIRKDQIDVDIATLIPEKLARRYHVIPILKIDHELTVVVDDPLNATIINDIETITNSHVKISLGRTSDILLAIDEIYGFSKDMYQQELETPPRFISPWFQKEDIQRILNDPSGQALMESILAVALSHGVSQIHCQPGNHINHINYRVKGGIQEQIQLSKEWYSILVFRLKIIAGFDIAEVSQPQYRECPYQIDVSEKQDATQATQEHITLAMSILPVVTGEAIALSFINKPLEGLWLLKQADEFRPLQQKELQEFHQFRASVPHLKFGTILVGGTPNLDKITTLYALLQEFDQVRKKVLTLESSLEYRADKYYQIRYSGNLSFHVRDSQDRIPGSEDVEQDVQHTKTHHFHASLRNYVQSDMHHILHPKQRRLSAWLALVKEQDADILLVDHIASDVVLAQCFDFAAQGVFFGLLGQQHVFDMLAYVLDCRIELSVVLSRVYALIAQQTVRVLCEKCKQKDTSDSGTQFLARFQLDDSKNQAVSSQAIYAAVGCPECNRSGYADHVVLFEILQMEAWLQEMLRSGRPFSDIHHSAEEKGFISLRKKSLDLLFSGQTSLEEVFSIIT